MLISPAVQSSIPLLALLLFTHGSRVHAQSPPSVDYDFAAPELVANLDDELQEISGLAYDQAGHDELIVVQDELGKIYRLNARSGRILWSVDFWKDGDYEGVEMVANDIWVVKNTGTLYRITNVGQPNQNTEKFNTFLTSDNDVEGLAYDPTRNRLLLACKRDADDDGNPKDGRYVFAFDLASQTLASEPVIAIVRQDVCKYLNHCPLTQAYDKLRGFFVEDEAYNLAPSAIAVHPITGRIFLTSSVGKVLMVLAPGGTIEYLERLDKDLYPQPEGLAFSGDGTLFISTEAKNSKPARLYRLPNRTK